MADSGPQQWRAWGRGRQAYIQSVGDQQTVPGEDGLTYHEEDRKEDNEVSQADKRRPRRELDLFRVIREAFVDVLPRGLEVVVDHGEGRLQADDLGPLLASTKETNRMQRSRKWGEDDRNLERSQRKKNRMVSEVLAPKQQ